MTQEQQQQPQTTTQRFDIQQGQHVLFVGPNGCGKSYLATALLHTQPHVFVIDEKAEFELPNARIVDDPEKLSRIRPQDTRPIIYRPKPEFWNDETYNAVFLWVYTRRNTTLYVDEIYAVMKESGRAPRWLQACLTRGRSLKITCFCATQRPVSVPISILSEAKHVFAWPLGMADDCKRVASLTSPNVCMSDLPEYYFWYYTCAAKNPDRNKPARVYVLKPAKKGT